MTRVGVAGGGPAGLAAAIFAADAGAEVTLFERNAAAGVKLLATGGGHCNLTNNRPVSEWPALFGRHGRFIVPALNFLPPSPLLAWLDGLGIPSELFDGFHYYPRSRSAREVRDKLVLAAKKRGVAFLTRSRVSGLEASDGAVHGIRTDERPHAFDRVVVATGGMCMPASGSTGDGLQWAEQLGHTVKPPVPGLVGLKAAGWDDSLAGVIIPDVEVRLKTRGRASIAGRGELLFTHEGVSGPAILDLSADAAEALAAGAGEAALTLSWKAGDTAASWRERLDAWRRERGSERVAALLKAFFPARFIEWLCAKAAVAAATPAAVLTAAGRDGLADALAAFRLVVADTEGWKRAMISRGGVELAAVDPKTMQSRMAKGLYFAGETLDIDGPCGGYNLQWAFSSGALAGVSAAGEPG